MALPTQRAFLRPILEITAKAEKGLSYKEILDELILLLTLSDSRFSEAAKRTADDAARNNKTILLIDGPKLIR